MSPPPQTLLMYALVEVFDLLHLQVYNLPKEWSQVGKGIFETSSRKSANAHADCKNLPHISQARKDE